MKKNRFYLVICLLIIQLNIYSQVIPSVYTGWGFGTNIGGTIGIGSEIKYKKVSLNAAVGSWIGEFPEHTGSQSRFDYDLGVKLY